MTNERGQFEMVFKEKKSGAANGGVGEVPWFRSASDTTPPSNGDVGAGAYAISDGAGGVTGSPGMVGGQASPGQIASGQQAQAQAGQGQISVDRPDFLMAGRAGYSEAADSVGKCGCGGARSGRGDDFADAGGEGRRACDVGGWRGCGGMPVELYRQTVQDGRVQWLLPDRRK